MNNLLHSKNQGLMQKIREGKDEDLGGQMLLRFVMRGGHLEKCSTKKFIPEVWTMLASRAQQRRPGKTDWVKSKETPTSFSLSLCPGTLPGTEG